MDIMRENEDISAALNRAEYVLAGIRGQTSGIFAAAVCDQHGITDAAVYEYIRVSQRFSNLVLTSENKSVIRKVQSAPLLCRSTQLDRQSSLAK